MPLDFTLNAFATLFVTLDPIGLAPIFLALTAGMENSERRQVAFRAIFASFCILVGFVFIGEILLKSLGISLSAFRISGGLLLFWTAFEMIFEKRQERKSETAERAVTLDHIRNLAIFPLAIPLIAGPGSISAVILLSARSTDSINLSILVGIIILLLCACLTVFLLASTIDKILGTTGRAILSRLLGVILAALAIQFIMDGILEFVPTTGV